MIGQIYYYDNWNDENIWKNNIQTIFTLFDFHLQTHTVNMKDMYKHIQYILNVTIPIQIMQTGDIVYED